jgi:hypothetical protein
MKKHDKALIGIVVGIILLVIIAFVVTLTRTPATYQADDTPEGVVNNYLLAITQEEYDRAYPYLSPSLEGYPESLEEFQDDIRDYYYWFHRDSSLSILSSDNDGDQATVYLRENRFDGVMFESRQYFDSFEIQLKWENGQWKIVDGNVYFAYCWTDEEGCDF